MRATVETHEDSLTLPPVKVRVSLGGEDLTIKVSYPPVLILQCNTSHVKAVFITVILLHKYIYNITM